MPEYADLVYTGRWFAPVREALDVFFAKATETVTGLVQVKLYKGTATTIASKSPFSLYSEDLATFGPSASFDHADSAGFVKLYGLPGAVAAGVRRENAQLLASKSHFKEPVRKSATKKGSTKSDATKPNGAKNGATKPSKKSKSAGPKLVAGKAR
jgi:hypothetical protein